METPKTGDKVKWKSRSGETHGEVVKMQTTPTQIKRHKVAASQNEPHFIVETTDGKQAAHRSGALSKE